MQREAELLRAARESTGLALEPMADLLGIESSALERLEQEADEPDISLLDRFALILGLRLDRFLEGEFRSAPAVLLFRHLRNQTPSIHELADSGAHRVLGQFLRRVGDLAELAQIASRHEPMPSWAWEVPGAPLKQLGLDPIPPEDPPYEQAERLALELRQQLGLGLEPIPSMIELVYERLQIEILWTHPDELDRDIDAASTLFPAPAILVNLIGGAECWWRTRMTLAHELCHLLFDRGVLDPKQRERLLLFSPDRGEARVRSRAAAASRGRERRFRLPEDLEQRERRANAWAAQFLAPSRGIRECIGARSPSGEETILLVCRRYGVGRTAAINLLTNTYRLSPEERLAMLERRSVEALPSEHPDRAPALGPLDTIVGMEERVLHALSRKWISQVQACDYLGLRLSDWISRDLCFGPEQRTPLQAPEERACLRAQRYLLGRHETRHCFPTSATQHDQGWLIEIAEPMVGAGGPPRPRGVLMLDRDLDVLEERSLILPEAMDAEDRH